MILPLLMMFVAPPTIEGTWDAAVLSNGQPVAFRLVIDRAGGQLRGSIMDGEHRIASTSGKFTGGKLSLRWDYYDANLDATLAGNELQGVYQRQWRQTIRKLEFTAKPHQAPAAAAEPPGQFAGEWILRAEGTGRATAMRALLRQSGPHVTGTVQRIDGDFGSLEGTASGPRLTLSHFDGIRATLLEATLSPDGTITGKLDGQTAFTGARSRDAKSKGLVEPPDPTQFTSMKDPSEPLRFQAPDLEGKMVSSSDARFRNKVMIVTIMGSWCPNCHDEAPFLNELYRKYQSRGLEIVALSFEYTGEVDRDREQIRAFNRRQGVTYLTLLAGTTNDGEVQRVLPQLADFGAFPTSIYAGRDGRVRSVHAGFSGPATGEEHTRLKHELEELVKKLLSE